MAVFETAALDHYATLPKFFYAIEYSIIEKEDNFVDISLTFTRDLCTRLCT